jgi:hypothetical protein
MSLVYASDRNMDPVILVTKSLLIHNRILILLSIAKLILRFDDLAGLVRGFSTLKEPDGILLQSEGYI